MENTYSIEELIETFTEHAKQSEIQTEIQRTKYKEEFGTDLPYDTTFNICRAFLTFAKEIQELKMRK